MFFYLSKIIGFLINPSTFLVLMLLVGLFLTRTIWSHAGVRIAKTAAGALLICGLLPVGDLLLLPLEQQFQRPALTDGADVAGIVVLGGVEEGRITDARGVVALNEAAERIVDAAALARRFPKARLIFTGGTAALVTAGENTAASARRAFIASGIDPARIELEPKARNTYENADFSKAMAQPKPGERWLLVTSAWHMPRSVGCFRAIGWSVEAWPVDYRTIGWSDLLTPEWSISDGLKRLDVATKEWIGLIAYRLSGRIPSFFPAP